ncbi:MAG: hypothetical protein GXY83_16735 [Rhodopirellula sp.]|nr:hypothetical protein [Rhodopirellula sp.]
MVPDSNPSHAGPQWRGVRFLAVAIGGSVAFLVLANTVPLDLQNAVLGAVVSVILACLIVPTPHQSTAPNPPLGGPADQQALADHPSLQVAANKLTRLLAEFASQSDEILQEAAVAKLAAVQEDVRHLAQGQLVFSATEAWRATYEQLLRSLDLHRYQSVAWLRNEDYWQDIPGRQSMQLNFDLLQQGVPIERILILCDFFWPFGAERPAADICDWIDEQYFRGMSIALVRESALEGEPDLLCDFGIYGNRATGLLELDEQCRTTRFTFDFSPEALRLAEDRWKRLALYAIPYGNLLDPGTRRS